MIAELALGVLAGTGIGVAGAISLYRYRLKRRALASYAAMRTAVALKSYTYSCWKLIIDNRNAEAAHGYELPHWDSDLPAMPEYPDDPEGWRALDAALANQALCLGNKIEVGQARIHSALEFDEGSVRTVVEAQAIGVGTEAWNLANEIRALYGLRASELPHGFSASNILDDVQREAWQRSADSLTAVEA